MCGRVRADLEAEEARIRSEAEAGGLRVFFLARVPDVGEDRVCPLVDVVVGHKLVQPV